MQKSLQSFCDKEVELDVYLPGTPHETTKLYDLFPYHIWGKGTNLAAINEANERKSEMRRKELVRRRDKPSCFEEACAYGNLQAVMLWWGQEVVEVPSRRALYEGSDASGLMWAAYRGHLSVVRFLVDRGAPLTYETSRGHTALKWSIIGGNLDVVRYLLDRGADPGHRDKQGHDAAFTAVQKSSLAVLMMLSEDALAARVLAMRSLDDHAAAAQDTSSGAQPILYVANAGVVNPNTGKPYFILDTKRRDVSGQTLVHWAAYTNRLAVLQYLVEYWGCDVNIADKYGRTALIWAAREGFAEIVEYLLLVGADHTVTDADGLTAEKYTVMRNHPEARYVLRKLPSRRHKLMKSRARANGAVEMRPLTRTHREEEEGERDVNSSSLRSPKNGAIAMGVSEDTDASPYNSFLSSPASGATAPSSSWSPVTLIRYLLSYPLKMAGWEYWSVREQRAASTFVLVLCDHVFFLMALMGFGFMIATVIFTRAFPPFMASVPFAAFFFKNMATTLIVGQPEQGSVDQPKSIVARMGVPSSFAQSVKGTWRTRSRDPSNMIAVIFFALFQAYCWPLMGNRSYVFYGPFRTGAPLTAYSNEYLSAHTLRQLRDPSSYFGGSLMALLGYENAESCLSLVLCVLFWTMLATAIACKLLSRLNVIPRGQEGDIHHAPIWRVLKARCYKWLHPRLYLCERHMQIPARGFYCPELDVVVRRYDGYSILLDCPIAGINHVLFVVFMTLFFVYELFVLTWGYTQIRLRMKSPVSGFESYTCRVAPFYANLFLPLRGTAGLQAAYANNTMVHGFVNITSAAQADRISAIADAPVSILSLTWLNDVIRVFVHGLPCPNVAYQRELLHRYLNGPKTWVHYILFLFYYYVWPSSLQMRGIWVLQYSAIAVVLLAVVVFRQCRAAVFRGATCMELANPLAPGSNGDLVLIFPPDIHAAKVMPPYDTDEEYFYQLTDPSKARTDEDTHQGSRCIFSPHNYLMNALRFFTFTQGREWNDAMSVNARNQPDRRPMLTS